MRVIKPSTLRAYASRHPAARAGLNQWLAITDRADWRSIVDVRRTYPHADSAVVGSGATVTIFNVGGNHFRLVVAIHYNTRRVYVRDFLTHAEYDRQTWKGRH